MSDYFIQSKNDVMYVSRIIDGELVPISSNGEIQFLRTEFWPLFKAKIEYDIGEKLAFIVLNDDKNGFEIDATINIAESFVTKIETLHTLIFENRIRDTEVISYPELKIDLESVASYSILEAADEESEKVAIENEEDNIQSFFRKKTRAIQRENKNVTGGK